MPNDGIMTPPHRADDTEPVKITREITWGQIMTVVVSLALSVAGPLLVTWRDVARLALAIDAQGKAIIETRGELLLLSTQMQVSSNKDVEHDVRLNNAENRLDRLERRVKW